MSQRNPLNERYQNDDRQGTTRKSAASAKPKTKAAASVHIQPTQKTKEQKKAEAKQRRAKQSELEREMYNPPTPEYKRLRRIWWVLVLTALAVVALSFVAKDVLPEAVSMVLLALAYVAIFAAFFLEFVKIKKIRRAYQEEMMGKKSKELRAREKEKKAQAKKAEKDAENAEASDEQKETAIGGFPGIRSNLKKLNFLKKKQNEKLEDKEDSAQ